MPYGSALIKKYENKKCPFCRKNRKLIRQNKVKCWGLCSMNVHNVSMKCEINLWAEVTCHLNKLFLFSTCYRWNKLFLPPTKIIRYVRCGSIWRVIALTFIYVIYEWVVFGCRQKTKKIKHVPQINISISSKVEIKIQRVENQNTCY